MSEATISVSSPSKSDVDQRKLLSVQDCNKILRIKVCTVFCENNVECAKLSWMFFSNIKVTATSSSVLG